MFEFNKLAQAVMECYGNREGVLRVDVDKKEKYLGVVVRDDGSTNTDILYVPKSKTALIFTFNRTYFTEERLSDILQQHAINTRLIPRIFGENITKDAYRKAKEAIEMLREAGIEKPHIQEFEDVYQYLPYSPSGMVEAKLLESITKLMDKVRKS